MPPGEDIRADVLRAAVDFGDLASMPISGTCSKGQSDLQRAEELKDKAARVSNDELLAKNDPRTMKDKATWEKYRDSAPEVVRRDAIVQFLRRLHDNTAATDAKAGLARSSSHCVGGKAESLGPLHPPSCFECRRR